MANPNKNISREEYLALEPVEFRARFRERVHHSLEVITYRAIHQNKPLDEKTTAIVKELISIWKEKGIPTDLPDFIWGKRTLDLAEAYIAGNKIDLSEYAPHPLSEKDVEAFEHIIKERRSVRAWTKDRVPDEIIDKILTAGSWAAHACNLQSVRYIVVREENAPGLVPSNIPGAPVHILILQDERVYNANLTMPIRNRLLDAGAAAQNIVLAAHAYGLGGVWLTHNDINLKKLYDYFKLDENIKIVTYVALGYPDQTPATVEKLKLEETVLVRI